MTFRHPRVWPPCTYLAVALTVHTAAVCANLLLSPTRAADAAFAATSGNLLHPAAICFGLYRVCGFHPALLPPYRTWLAMTPWTAAKALPLGPVHLVAADVMLLGAAFAAACPFYGVASSLLIFKVFFGAYLATLLLALFVTGEWFAAYAVWFGLGAMVLCRSIDSLFLATTAFTYGVGMLGFRRSLGGFPWNPAASDANGQLKTPVGWEAQSRTVLGWPFAHLAPGDRYTPLSRIHGTIIGLLGGWTAYVIVLLFPLEEQEGLYLVLGPPVLLASLCRLCVYRFTEHLPPISLAARIQTGRWIIPAFDRVYAAPVLAFLVAVSTPLVKVWWAVPASLLVPAGFTASLLILLTAGPDRRTWLLTAPSRIAPVAGNKNGLWA